MIRLLLHFTCDMPGPITPKELIFIIKKVCRHRLSVPIIHKPKSDITMKIIILLCFFTLTVTANAQKAALWNNKACAVVLTYDDAIDAALDNVIPALDSLNLRGTFYLIGSSPALAARMPEWRKAAAHGHELGNHSLYHPCDGSLPGRGFVTPETDLSKYTIARAVKEIRMNNTLLKAIDGKSTRTFAYPCGDLTIGGKNFYDG